MTQTVQKIIDTIYPLNSNSMNLILDALTIEILQEHDILFQSGRINKKEYFILEGAVHSYSTNQDGMDVTISFYPEGSIMIPHTVRSNDNISIIDAKALCPTKVASIDSSFFEQLMLTREDIRFFGNMVMRHELIRKTKKEIELASLTAKERLIQFREDFPHLENSIRQSHIASYLGITPISLSRLRSTL